MKTALWLEKVEQMIKGMRKKRSRDNTIMSLTILPFLVLPDLSHI